MDSFEDSVLEEQLRLAYRQLPGIIILPGLTALLLSAIFWGHLPRHTILIWLSIALLFTGGTSLILFLLHRKVGHDHYPARYWGRWFDSLAILSGLGWSSSVYFLYTPDNLNLQLVLLLFLYFAMALVALRMTIYRPAFVLLAVPIIIAITLRLLLDFDRLHALLAITTLFYGFTLYIFYMAVNRHSINYIRTIFEKNNLTEALQIRTIEAENENRSKSRFLAAASHDLRQPIVAQELLITALKAHIGEDKFPDIFRNIKDNIDSLHALFNELVEVSRLDTGNIITDIDYTDIEQLLNELESQFKPLAESKKIRLSIQKNTVDVISDTHLLKRILVNLISNAIKYTPKGEVKVYQEVTEDKVHIVIEDTGIGISKDDQKSIFHEFFRANNAGSYSDGFGLGLAIVKRLTDLLQHELLIDSQPGKGTTMTIILPVVPEFEE